MPLTDWIKLTLSAIAGVLVCIFLFGSSQVVFLGSAVGLIVLVQIVGVLADNWQSD